uniref:protein SENESCENCE-ASSOCIATED GENE 21, mitochondrial-like n=1 Tax=Erigeron canadensis TaxID=72917 RepID=UPI001CB9203C|nr:protein SENESCENCE-ASSOCIATED GENE 21, mitochondrial-like [Erigeron canadensis]
MEEMARPFSSANLISSFLVDQLVGVATLQGTCIYIVTYLRQVVLEPQPIYMGSGVAMMKKASEESKKSTPWVPDPVTGYRKPEGQTNQIDGADQLRELILKQKTRRS